jgi:L-lactate dehydrogenase complex protein LldG
MSARDEVLGRIRRALGPEPGAAAAGADYADAVPREYRAGSDLAVADLLDRLTERLHDYGSAVRRCGAGDLGATIASALADRGARRVVVPPGLSLDDVAQAQAQEDVSIVVDDALGPAELDAFDAVITTAAVAVAETGTIVLDGSPGQGRRALSLIPDYHLCILRDSQVVGLVTESIPMLDPRRPLTWISGPSATSDIELDRVQGVHGPRTLEVILVTS